MKEIGKSVLAKLNNIAKANNRQHTDLLQYYAMERFLYRLSKSKYREMFLLKGALLLQAIDNNLARTTKDIDFLATFLGKEQKIYQIVSECIEINVENDGVTFDKNTIKIMKIQRDSRYYGFRVHIRGNIDRAHIGVQLDIGFISKIEFTPIEIVYPQLLAFGSPNLVGSSLESAVADKFEAMVSRDDTNTRIKDFYDIWLLSSKRSFHFNDLSKAISETFQYYNTELPKDYPICFLPEFHENKKIESMWQFFLKRIRIQNNNSFSIICNHIANFLMPVCHHLIDDKKEFHVWIPEKGWQRNKDL